MLWTVKNLQPQYIHVGYQKIETQADGHQFVFSIISCKYSRIQNKCSFKVN